jgi:hypothetical protein
MVLVLSPENKTYETNAFPLNVTVNEDVLQIRYSLDGKENVTALGNTTLQNMPNGLHDVTVYAVDKVGKIGASESVTFTVDMLETTSQPDSFPWLTFAAVAVTIAFIAAVVGLVYLRRMEIPWPMNSREKLTITLYLLTNITSVITGMG